MTTRYFDIRPHAWTPHRFYFASGDVRFIEVQRDEYGCTPSHWKVMDAAELDLRIGTIAHEFKVMPPTRVRTFERRWYLYDPDFIGPHRDDDYHEA